MKKQDIDSKITYVSSYISEGIWGKKKYIQLINIQLKWEIKLSQFAEIDPIINEQQRKVLKDRIEARKKIIEEEEMKIEEEVDDDDEEEEENPKTDEKKKEKP